MGSQSPQQQKTSQRIIREVQGNYVLPPQHSPARTEQPQYESRRPTSTPSRNYYDQQPSSKNYQYESNMYVQEPALVMKGPEPVKEEPAVEAGFMSFFFSKKEAPASKKTVPIAVPTAAEGERYSAYGESQYRSKSPELQIPAQQNNLSYSTGYAASLALLAPQDEMTRSRTPKAAPASPTAPSQGSPKQGYDPEKMTILISVPDVCRSNDPIRTDGRVVRLRQDILRKYSMTVNIRVAVQTESPEWFVHVQYPDSPDSLIAFRGDLLHPSNEKFAPQSVYERINAALEAFQATRPIASEGLAQTAFVDVCHRYVRDCAYQVAVTNSTDGLDAIRRKYAASQNMERIDQYVRSSKGTDDEVALFDWELETLRTGISGVQAMPSYYFTLHGVRMSANAHRLVHRLFHVFGGRLPYWAWFSLVRKTDPSAIEQTFNSELWRVFAGAESKEGSMSIATFLQAVQGWFYSTEEYRQELQFNPLPPIKDLHLIGLLHQIDLLYALHVDQAELQRVLDHFGANVRLNTAPVPALILAPPAPSWFACCLPMAA
eukprot:CAMPEP_0196653330 /NCGR_PEP_ID=MMETSP1086-20130531/2942_1 /TAXON_ID=77921 /ORGANISM="Cyanoptyche  gloeocystis , Strain SAG4.97" /LENGTH=545 /DNA_ID=CAMNT_0041984475 /DNA_START=167 /DNA_END=1804 /DNA_ORIENTATION=-